MLTHCILVLTNGQYHLVNLSSGPYRIEIKRVGFKKLIKSDVILHVQDALEIDFEWPLSLPVKIKNGT